MAERADDPRFKEYELPFISFQGDQMDMAYDPILKKMVPKISYLGPVKKRQLEGIGYKFKQVEAGPDNTHINLPQTTHDKE